MDSHRIDWTILRYSGAVLTRSFQQKHLSASSLHDLRSAMYNKMCIIMYHIETNETMIFVNIHKRPFQTFLFADDHHYDSRTITRIVQCDPKMRGAGSSSAASYTPDQQHMSSRNFNISLIYLRKQHQSQIHRHTSYFHRSNTKQHLPSQPIMPPSNARSRPNHQNPLQRIPLLNRPLHPPLPLRSPHIHRNPLIATPHVHPRLLCRY